MPGGACDPGSEARLSTVTEASVVELCESVAIPATIGSGKLSATVDPGTNVKFTPSVEV